MSRKPSSPLIVVVFCYPVMGHSWFCSALSFLIEDFEEIVGQSIEEVVSKCPPRRGLPEPFFISQKQFS
jgi:hypothetical protein